MECFNYPIDTKYLLRKKLKLRKELKNSGKQFIQKKIAILGGSTTNEIADQLELFLLHYGIEPVFYQSEYGKYWEDAVFGNEQLDSFAPDIIYIHTTWRNIAKFPNVTDDENDVSVLLQNEYQRFENIWDSLFMKFHCPIIQNNFDKPSYRLLGNRDISDIHGRSNYISRLNQKIYEYSHTHNSFYINDIDYISSDYGLTAWADQTAWYMYKYAMSVDAIPILAGNVAKIVKAIYGKNKKVLALDMDNTLWGGIIGDDGIEGISIGPELPKGQAFSDFQTYCKELKSIGAILMINSKNDEKNALLGLTHPDTVLTADDFVSIKANWEPKNVNIINAAEELSLGTDSFVFVDDNPVERDIVRSNIPGVAVPNIQNVENYISALDHEGYFEVVSLSKEDTNKSELYRAKIRATKEQAIFSNYEDYLLSLDMRAIVRPFEELYYQRIAQLTNKSNQFNLTTLRCTEEEIVKMSTSENYITLYGKLEDKFADNGLVSVVAGEIVGNALHIRLWLMSCRVLKRGLEDVMMNTLVRVAKEHNLDTIYGYYYPTAKNSMVKDFYRNKGFILSQESENATSWVMTVKDYKELPIFMKVTE